MSQPFATLAVVLGGIDYGDSDRVITLLTRDRGKVPAFAAGARKSRRRFAGALEPFTVLDVRLSERRGDLLFLDSCSVVDGNGGLRDDLGRLAHAGHAIELCRELCRDREPHEELYDALVFYLGKLSVAEADPSELLAFELEVLGQVGFAPRFGDCAICQGPPGGALLFDPAHGGVLCGGCGAMAFPGALKVGVAALAAGARLQGLGPWRGGAIAEPGLRAEVRRMVRRFTHHCLGHLPRSLAFLDQMGIEG